LILLIIKTTVAPADLFKVRNEYYPYFMVKYTLNLIMIHSYASFLKPMVPGLVGGVRFPQAWKSVIRTPSSSQR